MASKPTFADFDIWSIVYILSSDPVRRTTIR